MRARVLGLMLVSLVWWPQARTAAPASLVVRNVTIVDEGRSTPSTSW